mgnify:CR=1 FL=1
MLIPYNQLSPDTLQALIEEFINREGTDYGEQEISIETKISRVMRQLNEGSIVIGYDEQSETVTLLAQWQATEHELEKPS